MLKLIKSNQKNFLAKLDIILQKRKTKDPKIDLKVKSIIQDIANLKKNKIFLIQLNRFMWEDVEKGIFRKNKRIRTVLKFDNVTHVLSKNINTENNKHFLDFLTIETILLPDKSYEVKLIFSGDAIIKIKTEIINVTLDDQGSPWESKTQPKHNF